MSTLRIVGDVHGQLSLDDVVVRGARPYLQLISDAPYSIQIGDMGDTETYDELVEKVEASRHRFLPGNHERYDCLPSHSLGDFGTASLGGVDFFFVRGAASTDRIKLVQTGRELGTVLWFEQEELTHEQMLMAEEEYIRVRPNLLLTHDGPTEVARRAWQNARRFEHPNPEAVFQPSRTTEFLARLLAHHQPRLWVFGHHHCNWSFKENGAQFICVGQLSYIDIDHAGELR